MMTLIKPRYNQVDEVVKDIRSNLSKNIALPLQETINFLQSLDSNLIINTYEQCMKDNNISFEVCCSALGSEEGATFYNGDYTQIYYRKDRYKPRKRWTIAHELGHYLMNHHIISFNHQNQLTIRLGKIMEQEANYFAKELLAPTSLVLLVASRYTSSLSAVDVYTVYRYFFDFSAQAAEYSTDFIFRNFSIIQGQFDINYYNQYKQPLSSIYDILPQHKYDEMIKYSEYSGTNANSTFIKFNMALINKYKQVETSTL